MLDGSADGRGAFSRAGQTRFCPRVARPSARGDLGAAVDRGFNPFFTEQNAN
jgi:hypothetical protein